MNKEELARQYAEKKVEERKEYPLYDMHRRKVLTSFDGYAIEQAFEDGFDKAVDMACKWLSNVPIEDMTYKYDDFDTSEGWYKLIDDFRKHMED